MAGDVFDGVLYCAVLFRHVLDEMSGTEFSQILRIFLSPFVSAQKCHISVISHHLRLKSKNKFSNLSKKIYALIYFYQISNFSRIIVS